MTSETQGNAIRLLLVEDNPGDVRLTQEALSESAYPNELYVAEDGEGAMARLLRQGDFGDAPLPDLIFLDLNLPRKDGFQVMREIREQPHLRHIPVVILTSSQAQEDMLSSYGLAVRSYIRKPLEASRFDMIAKGLVPRLATRIEGAEAWKAMARREAVEREESMVVEYTELAGLAEEDRVGRMQALAESVLDLPANAAARLRAVPAEGLAEARARGGQAGCRDLRADCRRVSPGTGPTLTCRWSATSYGSSLRRNRNGSSRWTPPSSGALLPSWKARRRSGGGGRSEVRARRRSLPDAGGGILRGPVTLGAV